MTVLRVDQHRQRRECQCAKKWRFFYNLIYFLGASCFGVGLWEWLVFAIGVIVSKQSLCSLFVSARCFLNLADTLYLCTTTDQLDSLFHQDTFGIFRRPTSFFATRSSSLAGTEHTLQTVTTQDTHEYLVFWGWQTEQLFSIVAEDCCYVRWSIVWNAGVTFGRVCVLHPLAQF